MVTLEYETYKLPKVLAYLKDEIRYIPPSFQIESVIKEAIFSVETIGKWSSRRDSFAVLRQALRFLRKKEILATGSYV